MKFFATAARGMPQLLAAELHRLGASKVVPANTGVAFEGGLETAYRACLWSRTASRILLPLTTVKAATPEQLYEEIRAIRWEKHLFSDGSFAVEVKSANATIGHSKYAALTVKDAVVDRFRERFDERPSVELESPDIRIHLQLRLDRARISLDLSGSSLHRRGYRVEGVLAPLKENLAAAILLEAGWPGIVRNGGALLDPMCGSGTLLIEGALIAADIAPGLYRDYYGFLRWRRHDETLWQKLLEEAEQRRTAGVKQLPPIIGYDADPASLRASEENILRAGLEGHIKVSLQDLEQQLPEAPAEHGLIATNPPYGERLGEVQALRSLYSRIGELMHALPGWQLALFTANPELAAHVGLRGRKPLTLFNGPLECQLFRYDPAQTTAARGAESAQPAASASEGAQMFANRLRKNLKNLGKWARREGIDCYRLYDADLPEYALAIDLYQGDKLWAHVQEYQAPRTVDPDKAMQRLQEALAVLPEVLQIPREQIHFKVRRKQKGSAQYEKQADTRHFHEVREGNCRLLVNFTDYLDTGLFLDHRITRQMIEEEARDRHFLNLFAYTGAATVHAAVGGARTTTTVDMSNTYLEWARRNMALNGYRGQQHSFIQADCTRWLEQEAKRGKQRFDLIFLDPPTFSSSKRMEESFDIQRDHVSLIRNAMALLSPGGLLIFSNNFRRFKLNREALSGLNIEELSERTLPRDFARNPHIHRCWKIRAPA
ncbi:MAG: bifunctional 23S rRNA (guanine(2069)-N(7))-methyltransferase RlmK/23S rRNA (guanine(2445)-N(2))-methyltransferase RlmL [Gammaproteobacteria bacterium]|nr:bifunctional 23S rRNA (guanine(2069)-N(7))-methyltransferase RlmK/23S rRNA (guanine(2445)-N(2))-methyltransferase RlmL [Gammaproteobacteria bacterium]